MFHEGGMESTWTGVTMRDHYSGPQWDHRTLGDLTWYRSCGLPRVPVQRLFAAEGPR